MDNEKLVTAILTQAVEDAKYTGIRKFYLKHKIEAVEDAKFTLGLNKKYLKHKIKKQYKNWIINNRSYV